MIVVEHDMHVIAESDWIIDIGPGAGEKGGRIVVSGPPQEIVKNKTSLTATYLQKYLTEN